MGYFANGTEGDLYQAQWCERCIHYDNDDCPIWNLHLLWSHGAKHSEEKRLALDYLIPRQGMVNLQCRLFYAQPKEAK